ncbi:hypothetical protein HBH98_065270 [Parastagonospora nodorum]|nr:hypothetical protein HBH98_065270 [Parastagonospora nodorum]KAH4379592.1 hypothetical protein HBH97_099030 [Parastagonospora nodorum]KAH4410972.1 hypothetical protein HBH99_072160 [Parastagonospora nodorum]KAH4904349.1 hypothetical protein HBI80_104250 [Parastagonospora nodorum]KAH5497164.1 hypothetical protein HBI31_096660 [Parastagonospora nodorum]
MMLYLIYLFLAMLALVVAKVHHPPPPPLPCGKSKTCEHCCGKHAACLQSCNFMNPNGGYCAALCARRSCTEGWAICKTDCDLPWCDEKNWGMQADTADASVPGTGSNITEALNNTAEDSHEG